MDTTPQTEIDLSEVDFDLDEIETSYTYKMNKERLIIADMVDGLEAIAQAAYKILNTERSEYSIYSDNYGVEFDVLYGQDAEWAVPEIERTVREALTQDDRIEDVRDFDFTVEKHDIYVTFTIVSNLGNVLVEDLVVNY